MYNAFSSLLEVARDCQVLMFLLPSPSPVCQSAYTLLVLIILMPVLRSAHIFTNADAGLKTI